MALQNKFRNDAPYPAGSVCYAYGLVCDAATLASGACPHPGLEGAVVVVFGALASTAACNVVRANLSAAPLAASVRGMQFCATSGCNDAPFVSAARRGAGAPGAAALLAPLLLAVACLVRP